MQNSHKSDTEDKFIWCQKITEKGLKREQNENTQMKRSDIYFKLTRFTVSLEIFSSLFLRPALLFVPFSSVN